MKKSPVIYYRLQVILESMITTARGEERVQLICTRMNSMPRTKA